MTMVTVEEVAAPPIDLQTLRDTIVERWCAVRGFTRDEFIARSIGLWKWQSNALILAYVFVEHLQAKDDDLQRLLAIPSEEGARQVRKLSYILKDKNEPWLLEGIEGVCNIAKIERKKNEQQAAAATAVQNTPEA